MRSPAVRVVALMLVIAAASACGRPPANGSPNIALATLVPIATPATPTPASADSPKASTDVPLIVPDGFRFARYASGLGEARMIAFNGEGVPFVSVMNRSTPDGGKVVALPDDDGDGSADRAVTVLDGLDRPHGLVWHDGAMYVSEPARIQRIIDADGDLVADGTEVIVSGIPDEGDHWARPFLFDDDGTILVAIGSTCNACQEGDKTRATIARYTPGGGRPAIVARGLRSIVGMTWGPDHGLWVAVHGRDRLGADTPPDTLIRVEEGAHYGWPYCYGDRTVDAEMLAMKTVVTQDRSPKDQFCAQHVSAPDLLLPAHVAPMAMAFYQGDQFPRRMRGGLFMAWHGAWDKINTNGYRIAFVPFEDGRPQAPEDFVTGWLLPDESSWYARPSAVAVGPDGALWVVDDTLGNLYRIDYAPISSLKAAPRADTPTPGGTATQH